MCSRNLTTSLACLCLLNKDQSVKDKTPLFDRPVARFNTGIAFCLVRIGKLLLDDDLAGIHSSLKKSTRPKSER